MGNKSRRTPRAPSVGKIAPPTRPPQFAVVREVTAGVSKINVINLDHIVHAVAHAYEEQIALELFTTDKPDPIFVGEAAANLLAHLILCGIDVEGAPAALARSRGDLYAPYFETVPLAEPGGLGGLPDPDEAAPDCCSGCAFETDERCDGWIPGGLDDACGAFEMIPTAEEEIGQTRQSTIADAGDRFDEEGGGCACLTPPPPAPPIQVERHGAGVNCHECVKVDRPDCTWSNNGHAPCPNFERSQTFDPRGALIRAGQANLKTGFKTGDTYTDTKDGKRYVLGDDMNWRLLFAPPPALALGEIHAHEVDAEIRALDAEEKQHGISAYQDTRAECAFGENCRRFPACGDCSLYALDRACAAAHDGAIMLGNEPTRRVVHVEHVEQVSGETSAALLARVERCGVFVGLKARGVVPGDQWCGVGHEMTDAACALCPYLRIYAPAL